MPGRLGLVVVFELLRGVSARDKLLRLRGRQPSCKSLGWRHESGVLDPLGLFPTYFLRHLYGRGVALGERFEPAIDRKFRL